jgi:hypothetical protein
LNEKAKAIIDEIHRADEWGLKQANSTSHNQTSVLTRRADVLVEAETKLSLAALKYAGLQAAAVSPIHAK